MSNILIIEDQVLIANHVKNILNEFGVFSIELSFNLSDAVIKIKNFSPNIILLDINVEGKDSGIEWALNNVVNEKVIFITGQTEMETLKKALDIKPVAYLTKPIKKIDLVAAIEVAKEQLKQQFVIIKDGYDSVKIILNDILFVKSDKNYIDIQTITKKFTIRSTLDNFLKELDEKQFIKVHRSYIINKEKIKIKTSSSIQIEHFEIPITRGLTINF